MNAFELQETLSQRRRFDWPKLVAALFGGWRRALVTFAVLVLIVWLGVPLLRWLLLNATWQGSSAECAARGGACWAFVAAKLQFFLFAFYPAEGLWRPVVVCGLLIALLLASAMPRLWSVRLVVAWPVVIGVCLALMSGLPGGSVVSSNQWGGLPITLLVWMICFTTSVPIAVLLSLARRSRMLLVRWLAIGYIELMRAIPMVAILYFATLILPMALPGSVPLDKLPRAIVMVALFWTAYVAEVVRGGLQVVPKGQEEAALALGLGYWRAMRLIVLPQALRAVVPGLVNLGIGFLLATSLLAVIGIMDILSAAKAAAADPEWLGYYKESFLVVALVYFVMGYGGSRYSLWLERRLGSSNGR